MEVNQKPTHKNIEEINVQTHKRMLPSSHQGVQFVTVVMMCVCKAINVPFYFIYSSTGKMAPIKHSLNDWCVF